MRFWRLRSMMPTFSRSLRVMERMIASMRSTCFSSMSTPLSMPPTPGSMPSSCFIGPMRRIIFICLRKSSSVNCPLASFSAASAASSSLTSCCARSTRLTTSPMPRMRPAARSGWNSSSASNFSPVPTNFTGAPVTVLTLSAAPPRVSLSNLVRTMPSTFIRAWNALALSTASWPVIASTTSRMLCGCMTRSTCSSSFMSSSFTCRRPAVSRIRTSNLPCFAAASARWQTPTATPTALPYSAHLSGSP